MTSVMMLWRFQVLETCICIELVSVWVLDRACHFAQSMGCDKVNLEALPECILHQEKDILTLVLDMAHWDSCYSWEIWLDELKVGKSSLEAMEKGKLIPLTISSKCGLASRWTHSIFAYANNGCDWYSYGPAGAAIIENTLMVLFGPTNFHMPCTPIFLNIHLVFPRATYSFMFNCWRQSVQQERRRHASNFRNKELTGSTDWN